jgi:hypothetical protein
MVWAQVTLVLTHFHYLTHTISSSSSKWYEGVNPRGSFGHHGATHEHSRSEGARFFIGATIEASSMLHQSWPWSDSFEAEARQWLCLPPSYFRRRYCMRRTLFLSIMNKLSKTSLYWLDSVAKVYRCFTSVSLWHGRWYDGWLYEIRENNCPRVSRVLLCGHHWLSWGWVLMSSILNVY